MQLCSSEEKYSWKQPPRGPSRRRVFRESLGRNRSSCSCRRSPDRCVIGASPTKGLNSIMSLNVNAINVRRRLRRLGLSDLAIDAAWPEWWSEDAESSL